VNLPGRPDELQISPEFKQDGVVFVHDGGTTWRSRDGGTSWFDLGEPGPAQVFGETMWLSPDFQADQTVFARATSTDSDVESMGLLVSHDAGTTWLSVPGLQLGGEPYGEWVSDVELSPGYAQDQTLFAVTSNIDQHMTAVLVSRDGGNTWSVSDQQTDRPAMPQLILSPSYSTDQVLLETLQYSTAGPSFGTCATALSTDAGNSWSWLDYTTHPSMPGEWTGVCGEGVLTINGTVAVIARPQLDQNVSGSEPLALSLDSGASWVPFEPPGETIAGLPLGVTAVVPNMVLEATERGDLWQFGALPS
jgi:hypothetical protein